MHPSIGYLIVNFGGPRTLLEVEPFLKALLTDQDVIKTGMPKFLHQYLFNRIAKKRVNKVAPDYEKIGGGSPIFGDTEWVAEKLQKKLEKPVLTFHRYLPATHAASLEAIEKLDVDEIHVFPCFPQFTYATTGSIARLFLQKLKPQTLNKLKWVKSYPSHPAFIQLFQNKLEFFLKDNQLCSEETIFLFSAHGLPQKYVDEGDLYLTECTSSFRKIMEKFPSVLGKLSFQSKFGPGEWLRPYTMDVCEKIMSWHEGRENIVFVPVTFTSDHLETLHEVESEYMTIIADQGLKPYRLSAFNRDEAWVEAIVEILQEFTPTHTSMLVNWR